MMALALVLFWVLVGLAAGQAITVIPFVRTMRRVPHASPTTAFYPKTAVILCLRGSDPFLTACLEAILRQDYPCYDLRIVVDSAGDPAWETVHRVLARCGAANVRVTPLTDRRSTCSLKCSSLVQAVSELDSSYEALALLDADTIPHRMWLRELVAPLADDRVAAATGNRWYMPASISWGSLTRWLWNAAAVVQMYLWRIPWGGTLALKMSVLRQSDVIDRWAHAFGEDTMLYRVLRRLGYRVAFVPSLVMVNREQCSLACFYHWIGRQLLTVRLYHPAWALVVGHGLGVSIAQGAGVVSLGAAVGLGHGPAAAWLAAGMGLYWITMAALVAVLETSVRRIPAARNEPTAWLRICDSPRLVPALLLTQVLYAVALLSALFGRTVQWRGIRYRVKGPEEIRMMEYRPYAGGDGSEQAAGSL
jgi:glycosyltransferase involved in cell wall biosynthesis